MMGRVLLIGYKELSENEFSESIKTVFKSAKRVISEPRELIAASLCTGAGPSNQPTNTTCLSDRINRIGTPTQHTKRNVIYLIEFHSTSPMEIRVLDCIPIVVVATQGISSHHLQFLFHWSTFMCFKYFAPTLFRRINTRPLSHVRYFQSTRIYKQN